MPGKGSFQPQKGALTSRTKPLETASREQLLEMRDKNEQLLSNASLLAKLPDKGAKIRDSQQRIVAFLENDIMTDRSSQSLEDDDQHKRNVRDERVAAANAEAKNGGGGSSILLQARKGADKNTPSPVKVQMMSLDESLKLQNADQQRIKEDRVRRQMDNVKSSLTSESLADDLSLTMERLKLDPETRPERPQDDDTEDEDSNESEYDGYDDDEGFEDDDEEYVDDRMAVHP